MFNPVIRGFQIVFVLIPLLVLKCQPNDAASNPV